MKKNFTNKKAMTIIEVMIAIFIFTLWLASVFMVISSAGNINTYNKNFIIASNLAREQIELIRNVRDTNYKKFQRWNMLHPGWIDYNKVFTGSTSYLYKIENWIWVWGFSIKFDTWTYISNFKNALKDKTNTDKENYRLCLKDNKYIFCNWDSSLKQTQFYKYLKIEQLKDKSWNPIENSLKINSVVYWNQKGIHKVEIPTILADYKRL